MSDSGNSAQKPSFKYKNSLEAFGDLGTSVAKDTASSIRDIGLGMFDQLMGNMPPERKPNTPERPRNNQVEHQGPRRIEKFNVFNIKKEEESREIQNLKKEIQQEIKLMKQMESMVQQDIKDIEKLTFESTPEEATIYHVRFMEIMISMLRAMRVKVNESHNWLQALIHKKKRRGFGSQKANMEPLVNSPQP